MHPMLFSPFWLIWSALALSLAWLIPNHTPPWLTFHSDALAASVIAALCLWVAWKSKASFGWHVLNLAVALCCLMPWLQYGSDQITVLGTAWINSLYLIGFLCVLIIGEKWESSAPGQCADFVFIAVLVAAVVSVGLQLRQWAGLDPIGFWTLRAVAPSRFYANLAQPNQLASLLLLGLLGCSWAVYRKKLSTVTAIFLACFVLVGVVLTESRTAMLNVILLMLGAIVFRHKLPSKHYLWTVIGLTIYFGACTVLLPMLGGDGSMPELRAPAASERLVAWKMFLNASLNQPIWGYGWGQLAQAYFLIVESYPNQPGLFTQSHNLLLDLILWNGYPIGLLLIAVLAWWTWKILTKVRDFGHLHSLGFVVVLGTHAMLEFPLQYAFFLLPFGLIAGTMHASFGFKPVWPGQNWLPRTLAIMAAIMLAITIRDYFRSETSFYGLRFQHYKIQTAIPPTPPDVLALTQFRDNIALARNTPKRNVDAKELQWMINTVNALPSSLLMYKLAANLAMNNRPHEAEQWLARLCKTMPEINCEDMRLAWVAASVSSPEMSAISWPNTALSETKP